MFSFLKSKKKGDIPRGEPQNNVQIELKNSRGATSFSELRAFDRYKFSDKNFCCIEFEKKCYSIFSLSYGGLALVGAPELLPIEIVGGCLRILDQVVMIDLVQVHSNDRFSGYQFRHQEPESLLFLRFFLEALRIGSNLHFIQPEHLKVPDDGVSIYLRGDGPTDVKLKKLNSQSKEYELSLHLTYRQKTRYYECRLSNGQVFTGKTIDEVGVSTRINIDPVVDLEIVRSAMCILVGWKNKNNENLTEIISLLESYLVPKS